MMLTYGQTLIANLRGEIPSELEVSYFSKEEARKRLVELTGQDFEYDHDKWESWLKDNTDEIVDIDDF